MESIYRIHNQSEPELVAFKDALDAVIYECKDTVLLDRLSDAMDVLMITNPTLLHRCDSSTILIAICDAVEDMQHELRDPN